MKCLISSSLVFSLGLFVCSTASAFSGKVVSVHDGDTFTLNTGTKVRLWGVDAAELDQSCQIGNRSVACGVESGNYLRSMIMNKQVDCEKKGTSGSRDVGLCVLEGDSTSINRKMAASGWAIEWTKYSNGAFSQADTSAQKNNRGLWQYSFEKPWKWRWSH